MPDETNTATTEPVNPPTEEIAPVREPEVIDKGDYILEETILTGQNEGFSFYSPSFKKETDEQVDKSFDLITTKYGKKLVVGLFENSLRSSIRVKAVNSLPKEADKTKQALAIAKEFETKPVRVNADEAWAFVPGFREITTQSKVMKAARLMGTGDPVQMQLGMKLMMEAQEELAQQIKEQLESQKEQEAAVTT